MTNSDRGREGVKNPENLADVICTCPHINHSSNSKFSPILIWWKWVVQLHPHIQTQCQHHRVIGKTHQRSRGHLKALQRHLVRAQASSRRPIKFSIYSDTFCRYQMIGLLVNYLCLQRHSGNSDTLA